MPARLAPAAQSLSLEPPCEQLGGLGLWPGRSRGARREPQTKVVPPDATPGAHGGARQGTTDYAHYLQNEPSPLQPATIVEKCTQKLVDEWNHMRCQASSRALIPPPGAALVAWAAWLAPPRAQAAGLAPCERQP